MHLTFKISLIYNYGLYFTLESDKYLSAKRINIKIMVNEIKSTPDTATNDSIKIEIIPIAQYSKSSRFDGFKNPLQLSSLNIKEPLSNKADLNVNYNLQNEDSKIYEVVINFSSTASHNGENIYNLEVKYGALFRLNSDTNTIPFQMLDQALKIYCANLVYPFVRQEVVKLTIEGGFPPLMIGMVDFKALYESKMPNNNYKIN